MAAYYEASRGILYLARPPSVNRRMRRETQDVKQVGDVHEGGGRRQKLPEGLQHLA